MKKLLIAVTLLASPAYAQTYNTIGNTTYGSDGSTYQKIGNTIYGSGGQTWTKVGNTYHGSDGSTHTQIGNTTFSNTEHGSYTTHQIGNTYYSGRSTCSSIGNTLFCD